MGAARRGLRNVLRSPLRSLLVVVLVALSVAISLTTWQVGSETQQQARALRRDIATLVQIIPLGVSGSAPPAPGGVLTTLPEPLADELRAVPNVARTEKTLGKQYIDNRQGLQAAIGVVMGVEPGATLRLASMGGFTGSPRIVAGRSLEPTDRGQSVAVVGQVFARQRDLAVGDELVLPAELLRGRTDAPSERNVTDLRARVVGIFATGVVYGDNQVFVPLDLAQRVFGRPNELLAIWLAVDDAANVGRVEADLRARLAGRADLLTAQAAAQFAAESLAALSANSLLAAAIAALIGGLVVLFTMALVTRERTREVGTLKALGASNADVAAQFAAEALAVAAAGGVGGLALAALVGSGATRLVLGAAALQTGGFALSAAAAAYGLGVALAFGVAGSLYPMRRALTLRPAEALRA